MLHGILILLVYQFIGLVLSKYIPIPSAVIGMVLLFITLIILKKVPKTIEDISNVLQSYLGLFFVPVGAGVSMYLDLIVNNISIMIIASVGATVATLSGSGYIFQAFLKKRK